MPRPADEIPRGALKAIVLAQLVRRPAHGYAVVQAVSRQTGGGLVLREGTLYPALHELELEGLVEASWEKSPEGRKRRVYALTARGRRQATQGRKRWLAMADLLRDLLALAPARSR